MDDNVSLIEWPTYSISDTAKARVSVREQVLNCTHCALHKNCTRPVPASYPSPATPPVFTVVGEAPGPDEDNAGKPFVGRAGRKLRELIRRANLDSNRVAYVNTVSCFPNENGKIRQPNSVESEKCIHNLIDQVRVAGSPYVLLVGSHALRTWRNEFNVSDVHGKVGFWLDQWLIMPVYHPSYVLRNRGMEQTLFEDLVKWRMVVSEELGRLDWLDDKCWICNEYVSWYDRDGVGYCGKHWARYGGDEGRWRQARGISQ